MRSSGRPNRMGRVAEAWLAGARRLTLVVGACLGTGVVADAGPWQETDEISLKAQARIAELFRFRVNLRLEDLARRTELTEGVLEAARDKLHAVSDAFFELHPVSVTQEGGISFEAAPIRFEPFSKLVESEAWTLALDEVFDEPTRKAFEAGRLERERELRESLSDYLWAVVERGLCLRAETRAELASVIDKAVDMKIESGVIGPVSNTFYLGGTTRWNSLTILIEAGLEDALTDEVGDRVRAMAKAKRRSSVDDLALEVEYLLGTREDWPEGARELLLGAADAITHRGRAVPKSNTLSFDPIVSRSVRDEWERFAAAILGLEDVSLFAELPSRKGDRVEEARSRYHFAILDRRAFFSPEQREGLAPLVGKYSEQHGRQGSSRLGSHRSDLDLPPAYGMSGESEMVRNSDGRGRLSTKARAIIDSFYEFCTEDQAEVLEQ